MWPEILNSRFPQKYWAAKTVFNND